MLFRTQIIFCSSELRLHFRIAEVGSLLSLNRAWRAQVTYRSTAGVVVSCKIPILAIRVRFPGSAPIFFFRKVDLYDIPANCIVSSGFRPQTDAV